MAKGFKHGSGVIRKPEEEITHYLFKEGAGFQNGLTGFTADNSDGSVSATPDAVSMTIKVRGSGEYVSSNETINLSDYSTVVFTGVTASFFGCSGYQNYARLYVGDAYAQIGEIRNQDGTFLTDGTVRVDVSNVSSGKLRGYFYSGDGDLVTCTIKFTGIYLEV